MIYYNLNTINDWNFGDDNIIKVYKHNAVCYYKITSGDTPTPVQEPCFAVVDDITQYQDTEFEDVYDKATEKWYKLNNLNQYEEYGIYGSGRTICEGSTSRLPQGYTEVEYIRQNSNYDAYINTGVIIFDNTTNTYTITTKLTSEFHSNLGCATIINCERVNSPYDGLGYRYKCSSRVNQLEFFGGNPNYTSSVVDNGDGTRTVTFQSSGNSSFTTDVPLSYFASFSSTTYGTNSTYRYSDATIYSASIVKNGITVRDFVPAKRDSDSVYGLYDLITDTFYTSPNGNNFIGGEPIAPTDCVTTYNGKLTIDDGYEYMYSGGSWVNLGEVSGSTVSLPDVPFTVNYNAKNYNSSTKTLLKTEGQLANVDAVITAGTPTVNDGYLTIATNTRATISGYQTYFNRTNSTPNLTIISKQRTNNNSDVHLFANRDSNYNWMYRATASQLKFHGSSQINGTNVTTQPVIESVRVDSSRTLKFNNYTDNTTTSVSNFRYGSTNSTTTALFAGYAKNTGEWFGGDFYWVYMCQGTLTDEQVQQVIDYNEGGGEPEYPKYYDEIQDPPDNLVFSSMAEAEAYECPWVGMHATIAGDKYVFSGDSQSGYEWVYNSSRLPSGYTEVEYVQNTGSSTINTNFYPNTNTRVLCEMEMITTQSYPKLFGAGTWNVNNSLYIEFATSLSVHWIGSTSTYSDYPKSFAFAKHKYDLDKGNLYINNTLVGTKTYSSVVSVSSPLAIFSYINNSTAGNADEHFIGKLYTFKIYDDGTLIRDFVPAKRDSDNVAGLYDIVNNVFYTPMETNIPLVAGDPV